MNIGLPTTKRFWLLLLPIILLTVLIRGLLVFNYLGFDYPSGADYGQHLYFSELYLAQGKLPRDIPYFQLGETQWSTLPGGSLTFAGMSAFSGSEPFNTAFTILIYAVIEVSGVYILAWIIFRTLSATMIAAIMAGILPLTPHMMSWGNYPNTIALAFIPWVFIVWLRYWYIPNAKNLVLAVIIIIGSLSIHHLSSLWIALSITLFSLGYCVVQPVRSLKKLVPIGLACLLVGLPVLLRMIELWHTLGTTNVVGNTTRYDITRIIWPIWAWLVLPLGLTFITAGLWTFFWNRTIRNPEKLLLASYLIVTFIFGFGWLFNIHFYYSRAIYFLTIPIAFGLVGLLFHWRTMISKLVMALVIISLASGIATERTITNRYQLQALREGAFEGADWLVQHSQPQDVVVIGTLLGFQLPRVLQRPTMVGLPADLVGNPQENDIAADAVDILTGSPNTATIVLKRHVRFVIVNKNVADRPNPVQFQQALVANSLFKLVYENSSMWIYEVHLSYDSF